MNIYAGIYKCVHIIPRMYNKLIVSPWKQKMFKQCGKKVHIAPKVSVNGWENMSVGNDVLLGPSLRVLTTRAQVIIGDHVMFGPNVTIITGDHSVGMMGKYMSEITDEQKCPEDDQDVVLEGDNWIGANVTILKGVTIGRGAVVAAGAVVTKNIPAHSICGGIPAKVIKLRFSEEELKEHLQMLEQR